jgi:hypothetical protein
MITQAEAKAILAGKPNRRATGGRAAKRAGDNLERAIMAGANASGAVKLFKLPSIGGRYIARGRFVAECIPCDFVGVLTGGKGFYFDAKSANEDAASLRVNCPDIVKAHQRAFLMAMERAGAVAGLLCESKRLGAYLWLAARDLAGDKPVRWDDYRWIRLGDTTRHVDFGPLITVYGGS